MSDNAMPDAAEAEEPKDDMENKDGMDSAGGPTGTKTEDQE